ncbi:MAG TPA: ABC transporter permease [Nitrospira sp.]|jgi:ABC-type transport system involved in multi-copper enzyme maturation permease subunit|nr:ABC transporter permease [Nitrospira sp.]
MNVILTIARNTFKEVLRDKVFYNLFVFALLMIGSALLLGTLTIGEQSKIIKDIGLASIDLFGVLIAIFVGVGLISKEIEKRTIYTIIAKPVHRYQFLLGRFAGLVFTMWVNTAVMLVAFCVILVVGGTSPDSGLMKAVGLMTVAQLIVLSAAMLFSTFTTPTLSGIFTLALYVIGELTPDLKTLSEKLSGVSRGLLSGSYYLLPNLALFNVKGEAVHGVPITAGYMLTAIGYGVSYAAVVLLLSCFVFQRRDF